MAQTAQLRRFDVIENEAQRVFMLQRDAYLKQPYPSLQERLDRLQKIERILVDNVEALAEAINKKFGDFAKFKEQFNAAATGRFGSGWAWLVKGPDGLEIIATANQDSPLTIGKTPIIGLDVWEHAYYLKYRNLRPDYIKAWWNVVNWDQAAENFEKA